MAKFYNLIYLSDLKAYTKGQGIPHWKPSDKLELGTIISFNETNTPDSPDDDHVPFGCDVLTISAEDPKSFTTHTMKADGASAMNRVPIFQDVQSRQIIKKVDIATKTLVDNHVNPVGMPANLVFMNPEHVPARRV